MADVVLNGEVNSADKPCSEPTQYLSNLTNDIDDRDCGDVNKFASLLSNRNVSTSSEESSFKNGAQIIIKASDIEILMTHFEISKSEAEKVLRSNRGDLESSANYLILL